MNNCDKKERNLKEKDYKNKTESPSTSSGLEERKALLYKSCGNRKEKDVL